MATVFLAMPLDWRLVKADTDSQILLPETRDASEMKWNF